MAPQALYIEYTDATFKTKKVRSLHNDLRTQCMHSPRAAHRPPALLTFHSPGFCPAAAQLFASCVQVRPADQEHLGMLGPLITAEVGDTVRVHFRNRLSFPTSVHVHGLWYAKNAEGAPYADGTSGA